MNARILLIEDDSGLANALRGVLGDEKYEVTVVSRGNEGLTAAQTGKFDVVLTDLKLPGLSGLDLVKQLHATHPRLPTILMTAHGTTETAIEATKLGAYDYLLKPFEMEELLDLVSKAVKSSRLMTEVVDLGQPIPGRNAIVGNSRPMQGVYKEIGRIATKPVNVLIRGETGTGKELVARAIYQHGDRAQKPFVAINCSAIPETLLESELFGHEHGAFTGADKQRIGRFEQAHGGTLFLDEIGDLQLTTQAKLLRVLQERVIQRLGGRETITVDVRVIAATHRDLDAMIREKTFREDLFYRLSGMVINLPALRQRAEDIPNLVRYFLNKYGTELVDSAPGISTEALNFLVTQQWPGNVRELENAVRQAILMARGYTITEEHVRKVMEKPSQQTQQDGQSLKDYVAALLLEAQAGKLERVHAVAVEEVERQVFGQAIKLANGNQAKAARWLGISRLTMRERLTQFGYRTPEAESETPG